MSVSAASSYQNVSLRDSLVPTLPSENAVTAAEAEKTNGSADAKHLSMFADGDDEPSFWDFLDVINPLQHIPIISDLYQELTGDKIGVAARLAGGALFGGPLGLIGAAANCVLEESTGKDAGGHMLALFEGDDAGKGDSGTALAAKEDKTPAPVAQAETMEASPQAQSQALAAAMPSKDSKAEEAAKPPSAGQAAPLVLDLVGQTGVPTESNPQPMASKADPISSRPVASAAPPDERAAAQVAALAEPPVPSAAKAGDVSRPMPVGRGGRFMPVPARTTELATQSPPAIGTTVSTTGYRSNAPIAGHRVMGQQAMTAALAQQMVEAQAQATGGSASGAESLSSPGSIQGNKDSGWFASNMMQALDKYERSSRLNERQGAGSAYTQ